MRELSLTDIAQPLQGELLGENCSFATVGTDSRQVASGELFVALTGESFDGHDYVERAAEDGAVAALISRPGVYPLPCLQVKDTRAALGQLAALNRTHFSGVLIGITGSSGKTTVKNMLASICALAGQTHATAGNFNNEIGLPLTLLQLAPQHQYAVIEMGASRIGDIAYLAALAQPDVAVLLNAQPAHLEGFGSLAAVARAKSEIYQSLADNGVGVVNADSEFCGLWEEVLGDRRSISFGCCEHAEVRAEAIEDRGALGCRFVLLSPQGGAAIQLQLAGRHNVDNALAAAAAALAAEVPLESIIAGLEAVRAAPGRLHVAKNTDGVLVVDDSYNANPGSVRAAIDVLVATPGRHILVLGAMGELGPDSDQLHRDVGSYAVEQGVDELWLVGDAAVAASGFGDAARVFADVASLPDLTSCFGAGDVVLVKGSRSAGMEQVVATLTSELGES